MGTRLLKVKPAEGRVFDVSVCHEYCRTDCTNHAYPNVAAHRAAQEKREAEE